MLFVGLFGSLLDEKTKETSCLSISIHYILSVCLFVYYLSVFCCLLVSY